MKTLLRECREAEDLSQGDLAERVGVTRQTINAIERDRYDPSLDLAFKLAYYFEMSVHDLFVWEGHGEVSSANVDESVEYPLSDTGAESQARRIVCLVSGLSTSMDTERTEELEGQIERIITNGGG